MFLHKAVLHNFRNYAKASFEFSQGATVIVGPNTVGKSNLIEALYLLSSGKSFRTEKPSIMLKFGQEVARVRGIVEDTGTVTKGIKELEVVLTNGQVAGVKTPFVRYLLNGVSRRKIDFAGNLPAIVFSPTDLETIVGPPSLRREFLDQVLEQVSFTYRQANLQYHKALRQRNALLEQIRENGRRNFATKYPIPNMPQMSYWNELLIRYGQLLTKEREAFLQCVNEQKKDLFQFRIEYACSEISEERLAQYSREEVAAAATLVGPHRDDFIVHMQDKYSSDIRYFGSRGQQRLAILQLKILQLEYITRALGQRPLLLLDDIFSELDERHIGHVLDIVDRQQTILTTTHEEFLANKEMRVLDLIKLA
jgi:DNA replication and repair protein RecF